LKKDITASEGEVTSLASAFSFLGEVGVKFTSCRAVPISTCPEFHDSIRQQIEKTNETHALGCRVTNSWASLLRKGARLLPS
jgi:hypothetical protein